MSSRGKTACSLLVWHKEKWWRVLVIYLGLSCFPRLTFRDKARCRWNPLPIHCLKQGFFMQAGLCTSLKSGMATSAGKHVKAAKSSCSLMAARSSELMWDLNSDCEGSSFPAVFHWPWKWSLKSCSCTCTCWVFAWESDWSCEKEKKAPVSLPCVDFVVWWKKRQFLLTVFWNFVFNWESLEPLWWFIPSQHLSPTWPLTHCLTVGWRREFLAMRLQQS